MTECGSIFSFIIDEYKEGASQPLNFWKPLNLSNLDFSQRGNLSVSSNILLPLGDLQTSTQKAHAHDGK